jgi:hypothetical protein
VRIGKDVPVGRHQIELGLEITNLHVAPGRDLRVKLPLRLDVTKGVQ